MQKEFKKSGEKTYPLCTILSLEEEEFLTRGALMPVEKRLEIGNGKEARTPCGQDTLNI